MVYHVYFKFGFWRIRQEEPARSLDYSLKAKDEAIGKARRYASAVDGTLIVHNEDESIEFIENYPDTIFL